MHVKYCLIPMQYQTNAKKSQKKCIQSKIPFPLLLWGCINGHKLVAKGALCCMVSTCTVPWLQELATCSDHFSCSPVR
ncbi:hypothetical protein GDO81_006093 [Engystomops pustulosus]|uniref:Uncharacterized protein n=1 Tax=Engystomops pustulosus TaxID=76066 RepID=A0AAV7CUF3_ENGPU|nr:hypothetical protein GDO81_006093 [Engystomops pustulosus]